MGKQQLIQIQCVRMQQGSSILSLILQHQHTHGQGTNSITVDWGGVPGLYSNAVYVFETNSSNCPGALVNLDVYVLQIGLPVLGPFCIGDPLAALGGTPLGGT